MCVLSDLEEIIMV